MARILIADRVAERRAILCTFLRGEEHVVIPVTNDAEDPIRYLREVQPELVITEGSVAGARLLAKIKEVEPDTAVIMVLAGAPSVAQTIELMNQGVSDLLVSPLDISDVRSKVDRALARHPGIISSQLRFHNLVGSSPKMQQIFRKMLKLAPASSAILICGEEGTGKQSVGEQIHKLSRRRDSPFQVLHCSGLGSSELEIELFGHELPTAQTRERRIGLLENCDTGILFLHEVDALPLPLQTRVMRYLETHSFERVGGTHLISTDVRLIAATTVPLVSWVQDGRFRGDLYYILSEGLLELPPLRSRVGDIAELADVFMSKYDVQVPGEAIEVLMNYSWPGNVDELKNALEQAANTCDDNRIELKDLPQRILKAVATAGRRHKYVPRAKSGETNT